MWLPFLLFAWLGVFALPTVAAGGDFAIAGYERQLTRLTADLNRATEQKQLQAVADAATALRDQGTKCIEEKSKALTQLLESLGPLATEQAKVQKGQVGVLQRKQESLQKELAACRYLVVQADGVLEAVSQKKRQLQKRKLFYRQEDIFQDLLSALRGGGAFWKTRQPLVIAPEEQPLMEAMFWLAALAVVSSLSCFLVMEGVRRHAGLAGSPILSLRLAILFSAFLVVIVSWVWWPLTVFAELLGLGALVLALLLLPLTRDGRLFVFLTLLPVIIAGYIECTSLHGVFASELLAIMRFGVSVSVTALLFLTFAKRKRWALLERHSHLLLLVCLGNLASSVAHGLGYQNFGRYLFVAVTGSGIGYVLLRQILTIIDRSYQEFLSGSGRFWTWLRIISGARKDGQAPALAWLKIFLKLSLWLGYASLVVMLWDASGTALPAMVGMVRQGIRIGSVTLVPTRIFTGFLMFGLAWSLFGWLSRRVEQELTESRLNKAGRDITLTILNYSGFGLAILFGLGVAGVDFSGLALMAGALSVGIGFGLQNIVNNFVSGLILLFERPIKRGDWIVVGDTEGYVKKISVRSTIIRTFDKADVIVPNSELISAQVTNWMLSDQVGRVRVPVGVAYGSDTGLVRQILLEVAHAHPLVITDGSEPRPDVLFTGFGDSSLDFELRCYIKDIDSRLIVKSDLNFAIDAAFRRHGVEIPFPQRDLHVKDLPAGAKAPR